MHLEEERLRFLEERDGTEGARVFAARALSQYRAALKERNANGKRCGYGSAYRRSLVLSCLDFRQYLRQS